jgi:hypothetical protein
VFAARPRHGGLLVTLLVVVVSCGSQAAEHGLDTGLKQALMRT